MEAPPDKIPNPFRKTSRQLVVLGLLLMVGANLLPENPYLLGVKYMLPIVMIMLGYILMYLGRKQQKMYPSLLLSKQIWWPVNQKNIDEQIHVDVDFRHQQAIKNGSYFLLAGIILPLLTDATIEIGLGIGATLFVSVLGLSLSLKRAAIKGLSENRSFVLIAQDGLHIPGLTLSWTQDKGILESVEFVEGDGNQTYLGFEMYFPGFNRFSGEYLREQRARVPVPSEKRDEVRTWINSFQ